MELFKLTRGNFLYYRRMSDRGAVNNNNVRIRMLEPQLILSLEKIKYGYEVVDESYTNIQEVELEKKQSDYKEGVMVSVEYKVYSFNLGRVMHINKTQLDTCPIV